MKQLIPYSLVLVLFQGCTNEVDLKSIDYSALLSDGNSKVWLMDQEEVNDINITESMRYNKKVVVFHNSGTVNMIPMSAIGEKEPERGYYLMNSNDKVLRIEFGEEIWLLKAQYLTEDSLRFVPLNESDLQIGFKLIPFPEL